MADIVFPGDAANPTRLNADAMPENIDMDIYKGDFVDVLVTVNSSPGVPMNLTGYTGAAVIKADYDSPTVVAFNVTIPNPAVGQVRLYLPTEDSAMLEAGDYIWDFELINDNGDARTYMTGDVTVYPEVTVTPPL